MRSRKAFTLIELLVVVAIIGILAAMILVALNQARLKARDGRIKGAMAQIRTQAEVVYDNDNSYANLCDNATVDQLEADIGRNNGSNTCAATASTYTVIATLATGGSMCINQTGQTFSDAACTTPL